jgi:hypothetical protein
MLDLAEAMDDLLERWIQGLYYDLPREEVPIEEFSIAKEQVDRAILRYFQETMRIKDTVLS